MKPEGTIKRLKRLYRYHSLAAESSENWATHDEIMQQAAWLMEGIVLLEKLREENEQLRARLVRQACYFEHIEAKQEPRAPGQQGWPLLEDTGEEL
jgi:hypothetical protein